MKDYKDLTELTDKKLRTLRNNLNNRLVTLRAGKEKHLSPSHMLHGYDEKGCSDLLARVLTAIKKRS